MNRYPTLRPDLYALLVNTLISQAHGNRTVVNVQTEASRISQTCGISFGIVERDILEAGTAARIPLELGPPFLAAVM